jgi:hypothetical protein
VRIPAVHGQRERKEKTIFFVLLLYGSKSKFSELFLFFNGVIRSSPAYLSFFFQSCYAVLSSIPVVYPRQLKVTERFDQWID